MFRAERRETGRGAIVLSLALSLLALWPSSAEATVVDDFARARETYARGEYQRAVVLFDALVQATQSSDRHRIIYERSLKYLGASYFYLGSEDQARAQFARLLRIREDIQFEAYIFGNDATELFERLREEARRRRVEIDEDYERVVRELEELRVQLRVATETLYTIASRESVEIQHDPRLAWVPFGAGQFQNGNEGLGWFFFGSELTLTLLAAGSIAAWVPLDATRRHGAGLSSLGGTFVDVLQFTTLISSGLLLTITVAGIIDALSNYVPSHTETRLREPPRDAIEVLERLELLLTPGGVLIRGEY